VEGLDLDEKLLELARAKHPEVSFHEGDMVDFELGKAFGVVTCLFSAIGYVKTLQRLNAAIARMARHTLPGGVLIVEPWIGPDRYEPGRVHVAQVDEPDLKITRMNSTSLRENLSVMEMHYLVGTPQGVEHFVELHEMGLFTHEQYVEAFRQVGLGLLYDPNGLIGRGLYVGQKPL